jgi:undecaprenyl-diphosphatase
VDSLWQFDQGLFKDIHIGLHSSFLDPIFFVISTTGVSWVLIIICLALFPWQSFLAPKQGNFWQRLRSTPDKTVPLAFSAIVGLAVSGLADDLLVKQFIERERPSNFAWAQPQENIYAHSFASGHTSTAFGAAFMVFFLTRGSKKNRLGWLALVWACLVGFSRIYRGVHWPTDVLGGIFVALACTSVLVYLLPDWFRQSPKEPEIAK